MFGRKRASEVTSQKNPTVRDYIEAFRKPLELSSVRVRQRIFCYNRCQFGRFIKVWKKIPTAKTTTSQQQINNKWTTNQQQINNKSTQTRCKEWG